MIGRNNFQMNELIPDRNENDSPSNQKKSHTLPHAQKWSLTDFRYRRSTGNIYETSPKFFSHLNSKPHTKFIEKFIRNELLNGYDSLKCQKGGSKLISTKAKSRPDRISVYTNWQLDKRGLNCIRDNYPCDEEMYEMVQVKRSQCSFSLNQFENVPLKSLCKSGHLKNQNPTESLKPFSQATKGIKVQRSTSGSSLSGITKEENLSIKCRFINLISSYDQQNKQLHRELANEKLRRTIELDSVIKSLLVFEAKLKRDMKTAGQRLLDRDMEICRLVRLNCALRKRLDNQQQKQRKAAVQNPDGCNCMVMEALLCNKCRKKFYEVELNENNQNPTKEMSLRKNPNPSSSSDDTVASSFDGARRSEPYTTKRTTSTFWDYMRSRSMHIYDPELDQQSEENTSSISQEDSQISYEHIHPNAPTMERRLEEISAPKPNYSEQSSLELDLHQKPLHFLAIPKIENCDGISSSMRGDFKAYGAFYSTQELKMIQSNLGGVQKRCSDFSEASPKQIYETTGDDWYATASDQEGSTISSKPYSLGAVNPVLECVNQILLQQSMEDTLKEPTKCKTDNFGSTFIRPCRSHITTGRKRVHFSTKNSMVHLPRNNEEANGSIERLQPVISLYNVLPNVGDTSNYESVYSNDYEPIGSEIASNDYIDMASGGHTALKPTQRIPPDLPPKPANLLKFKKLLHPFGGLKNDSNCATSTATISEPDYCSICELGVASVRVQTMADIHQEPKSTSPMSKKSTAIPEKDHQRINLVDSHLQKTDEIEEIFADVPKLPNVAAIIVPKQTSSSYLRMTTRDTLCLNIPPQTLEASQPSTQLKRELVPNIISEINKRLNKPGCPSKLTPDTSCIPVLKSMKYQLPDPSKVLPIQAEFDWYNLDVEYECAPKPNKSSMVEGVLKSEQIYCSKNSADEYNLDEEFQHEEHPLKDSVSQSQAPSNQTIQIEQIAETAVQAQTIMGNFDKFIKGSELSTKPITCKRKIYFNTPFV
ncbi:uncharacterized protein [Drosophila bipectinata]|uniref:uncharacterized protein isoform X1 n=2 Tax=Drosophila bipectinata TaxID=42026 RepID=UPI001C8A89E1|nr:uncharacterized protein LOC108120239 [Drosophila bipectinata]XP_043069665.1 uncharacterized protein LOC108120239 [Drosophila bipectinata]